MALVNMLLKILISAFFTEKFVKEMILFLLEKISVKTDNHVDDELVAKVKEAFYPKQ